VLKTIYRESLDETTNYGHYLRGRRLERALQFYRDRLGFPSQGIVGQEFEHGAVAFFDLQAGLKLALWARQDIAHETGIPQATGSPTEFTIGHNVGSKEEVDQVMAQAKKAGAAIPDPAHDTFWGGYSGHFQDRTVICGKSPGIQSWESQE